MAARIPRRSFATPFVVTLAAAPACYTASSPPPQEPQTTREPAPAPEPEPSRPPPTVVANPPRPQPPAPKPTPPPPTQQTATKWSVFKSKDGCMAAIKVECQPKATCNPPPPFKYACPEGVTLDAPITVASYDSGATCFVEQAMPKCPPNVMCNPPPPKQVTCPKR